MNTRLAPAVLALALLAGCRDNAASIEIFETCLPPAPDTTTGQCAYPATCAAQPLGTYMIDLAGTDILSAVMQVNNQLANNAKPDTGQVNTNDAHVDTFTVSYEVPGVSLASVVGPVQIQNTIPASGAGVVAVDLLKLSAADFATLSAAAPVHIVATMRLKGSIDDGSRFETAERKYGIDACVGCMGVPSCPTGNHAATCPGTGFQWPMTAACVAN
jgi:hypothetical protein